MKTRIYATPAVKGLIYNIFHFLFYQINVYLIYLLETFAMADRMTLLQCNPMEQTATS